MNINQLSPFTAGISNAVGVYQSTGIADDGLVPRLAAGERVPGRRRVEPVGPGLEGGGESVVLVELHPAPTGLSDICGWVDVDPCQLRMAERWLQFVQEPKILCIVSQRKRRY